MGSYVSVVNDVDDAALFVAFGYNEQALGYAIAGIQLAFAILSGLRSPGAYNPLSDILKAEGKAFFSIAKDSYTNGQRLEFTASAVNAYQAANGGFSANSLDEMAFALFTAYATGDKEFDKDGTNIGGLDLHRGPRNIGKATNGYFQDGEYSLSLVLQANTFVVRSEGTNRYRLCRGHFTVFSGPTDDSHNRYYLSNRINSLCSDSILFSVTRECPPNAICQGDDGTVVIGCKSAGEYVINSFTCVPCPTGSATCDSGGFALTCLPNQIYHPDTRTCRLCPAGQYNILGNICAPCPGNLLVATCDNFGVTTSCYYGSVLGLKTPGVCDCPNNQYVTTQSPNYPIFMQPVTPRCASCLDVGVATCTGHLFPTTCKPNYHLDSGSGLQVGAASVRCCFENQFSADDGFGAGATYADGTYVPGYYQEQFGQDPLTVPCRRCTGDFVARCEYSQVAPYNRATLCRIDKVLISPLNTTNMYAPPLAPICVDSCPDKYFVTVPIPGTVGRRCDRCAEGVLTCASSEFALTCETGSPLGGQCALAGVPVPPTPVAPVPEPVASVSRARAKRELNAMSLESQMSPTFNLCPLGETACPIHAGGGGGYECLDVAASLSSCGGCLFSDSPLRPGGGTDCLTIPGAMGVGCNDSKCIVSSCMPDWELRDGECMPRESHLAELLARRRLRTALK